MAVCDPSQNPPIPKGLRLMQDGEVTPKMQAWAKGYADDLSIRIPTYFKRWWGNLPVVAAVLCHTSTRQGGVDIPGLYHGVTLFVATSPEWYPPADRTTTDAGTDWPMVVVGGVAIATVTSLFFLAIRKAAAAMARR